MRNWPCAATVIGVVAVSMGCVPPYQETTNNKTKRDRAVHGGKGILALKVSATSRHGASYEVRHVSGSFEDGPGRHSFSQDVHADGWLFLAAEGAPYGLSPDEDPSVDPAAFTLGTVSLNVGRIDLPSGLSLKVSVGQERLPISLYSYSLVEAEGDRIDGHRELEFFSQSASDHYLRVAPEGEWAERLREAQVRDQEEVKESPRNTDVSSWGVLQDVRGDVTIVGGNFEIPAELGKLYVGETLRSTEDSAYSVLFGDGRRAEVTGASSMTVSAEGNANYRSLGAATIQWR